MTDRSNRRDRLIQGFILFVLTPIIAALASLATARPVEAGGICGSSNGSNAKMFILKHQGNTGYPTNDFDRVSATAKIATLDACTGAGNPLGTGSYVLPVNFDDGNVGLMQFGYGTFQAGGNNSPEFIYTPDGNGVPDFWPGSMSPILGSRYRFTIDKYLSGGSWYARYTLTRVSTGQSEAFLGHWAGNAMMVWWGAETLDSGSYLGAEQGGTYDEIDITDMTYSQTSYSSNITRNGLQNNYWGNSSCPPGSTNYVERDCKFRTGSYGSQETGTTYQSSGATSNDSFDVRND